MFALESTKPFRSFAFQVISETCRDKINTKILFDLKRSRIKSNFTLYDV